MGLMSISGRILFSWLFIYSAVLTFKEAGSNYDLVEKEYLDKMARNLHRLYFLTKEDKKTFVCISTSALTTLKGLAGVGFVFGRLEGALGLATYLIITTPLYEDFYHYRVGEQDFPLRLHGFLLNMAFLSILFPFIKMKIKRMKVKIPQRQMEVMQASQVESKVPPSHSKGKKKRTRSKRT